MWPEPCSTSTTSNEAVESAEGTMNTETTLRDHLVRLLTSAWAHVTAEEGIANVPPDQRGARLPGHPHTIWQLLEHLRICQDCIKAAIWDFIGPTDPCEQPL